MIIAGRALRLITGVALAWCVVGAAATPALPVLCKAAAAVIVAATVWQPVWGLALTTMLTPMGALLAGPPVRSAELFAWAFLAAWLLSVWRPLSATGWPRGVTIPGSLYAAALIASWLALAIGGAAGVMPSALPMFLATAIGGDHLLVSSPEPETWTVLQALGGIGVFLAATAIARDDSRTVRWLGLALVASMTVLAAATVVVVPEMSGDRFSLPFADLNAAGSLYALAAVIALGCAWRQPRRRFIWLAVLIVLGTAIWLTGSRSAYLGVVAGIVVLAAVWKRWQPTRPHLLLGAFGFVAAILVAGAFVAPPSQTDGSAEQSANLRSQFLVTTARMFAAAPAFGVGIGRYYDRSAEFMTPDLTELYGNENAHNYFAQQFAELGLVGGLLFVWLVGSVLFHGWRAVLEAPDHTALHALFAGTVAYTLTCVTGHPLLVPQSALPFWGAFGAVAAASSGPSAARQWRALAVAAGLVLAVGVGRGAAAYAWPEEQPAERGFHQMETTRDGGQFRWMTRHGVMYIPEEPGFLRLRMRAPGWPAPSPVVVETFVAGQRVESHVVMPDESTTWDVPARPTRRRGFRRVDFRVNHEWFEEIKLGRRTARRPVSVMVERITWMPLR